MALAISVPGFAATLGQINASLAVKSQNGSKNSIAYQQKLIELEALKANLKETPGFNAKINNENTIEIYTNEVAKINEKAALSGSGFVYGPWFGGSDSVYDMSPSEEVKLLVVLTGALVTFLSNPGIAARAASAISGAIGAYYTVTPGQWVSVDRIKRYREVKYYDGTFAYYQTKIGASATRSDTYLGSGETIISGGLW